jgi:hypothetical protein
MKKILLLIALAIASLNVFSQDKMHKKDHMHRYMIEQQKYISNYANINEDQAKDFFPIYFEFMKTKRSLHIEVNNLLRKKNIKKLNIESCEAILNKVKSLNKKRSTLENKFYNDAGKIISVKQILLVVKAERAFRKELLRHLKPKHKKRKYHN